MKVLMMFLLTLFVVACASYDGPQRDVASKTKKEEESNKVKKVDRYRPEFGIWDSNH